MLEHHLQHFQSNKSSPMLLYYFFKSLLLILSVAFAKLPTYGDVNTQTPIVKRCACVCVCVCGTSTDKTIHTYTHTYVHIYEGLLSVSVKQINSQGFDQPERIVKDICPKYYGTTLPWGRVWSDEDEKLASCLHSLYLNLQSGRHRALGSDIEHWGSTGLHAWKLHMESII